jgi:hypothetical protein
MGMRSRARCLRGDQLTSVSRLALLGPGFELPPPVRLAYQEFDDRSAKILDGMADRLETKSSLEKDNFEDSFERLEQTIRSCCSEGPQELLSPELQAFLAPSRSIESVAMSLAEEI